MISDGYPNRLVPANFAESFIGMMNRYFMLSELMAIYITFLTLEIIVDILQRS